MSLYVVLKSKDAHGKQNAIERHIPFKNLPTLVNEEIDYIQADGDELIAIRQLFPEAIPFPQGKRVVRWFGDLAKTIYYNL